MIAPPTRDSSAEPQHVPSLWMLEDSPLEAEIARRCFAGEFSVEWFTDGATLIERLASARPDLLVLDAELPGMSGKEVCEFVRSQHDALQLPILMVTANQGRDILLAALAAGANDFLTKPYDAAELLARTRTLVRMKLAHGRAELASRLKDEFLATISHELRTPLNAILGWTASLRAKKLAPEVDRVLGIVERNARLQARLIDDVLDMSRIMGGKLRLERTPTFLEAVVGAAVETVAPMASAKAITLTVAVDPDVGMIMADPDRLQQVVWNVVSNALKFTPSGGRVGLHASRAGMSVVIEVTDSGDGIAPEFLPHVFEAFRQADGATTRRQGGLGLGLAIVKQLVQAHGGDIRATSEGKGRGATFSIDLPGQVVVPALSTERVSAVTRQSVASIAAPPPRLDHLNVMIVDDDEDARIILTESLAGGGATVNAAASAEEALELLDRVKPDVIVSDIGMPAIDGYTLLRRIRALPPERGGLTPAIALTAYARIEDERLALAAGFQAHIAKPAEIGRVMTLIADLAASSRSLR